MGRDYSYLCLTDGETGPQKSEVMRPWSHSEWQSQGSARPKWASHCGWAQVLVHSGKNEVCGREGHDLWWPQCLPLGQALYLLELQCSHLRSQNKDTCLGGPLGHVKCPAHLVARSQDTEH